MNTKYHVGQPIVYQEKSGGGYYKKYSYICWDDRIKTIDGNLVTTEAGIKLKISDGQYSYNYGDLVFRGRMPKNHGLVNDMFGKEMPGNMPCTFGNAPIYDLKIIAFKNDSQRNHYHTMRLEEWADDLKNAKDRDAYQKEQVRREAIALKELNELKARNDKIRIQMLEEEQALEQKLIQKYAKEVECWKQSDGTTVYFCKEW